MSLVLVGDAAYPPAVSVYPVDMVAVGGYLGGVTPHVWTDSEIATLRGTGREFWPIWTAPNSKSGTSIGPVDGRDDGEGMLAQLRARGIGPDVPVLYDVEYSTYVANPTGAQAAIRLFEQIVRDGGYPAVYPYAPKAYNKGWVAWWTNIRPDSLPVGWVGQQFGGITDKSGRTILDLSVFDLDRLGVTMATISPDDVERIATATEQKVAAYIQQYMPAQFGGSINRVVQILGLETAEAADVAAIKARLASVGQPESSVDDHALAVELANVFGTALSTVK